MGFAVLRRQNRRKLEFWRLKNFVLGLFSVFEATFRSQTADLLRGFLRYPAFLSRFASSVTRFALAVTTVQKSTECDQKSTECDTKSTGRDISMSFRDTFRSLRDASQK